MNTKPLMPIIVMQFIPLLILPPELLFSITGVVTAVILALVFVGLGSAILRRKTWALNLSIFLHGFNVIVRLMMLFPNAMSSGGVWDLAYLATGIISIALSTWFLFRLDKADFHALVSA